MDHRGPKTYGWIRIRYNARRHGGNKINFRAMSKISRYLKKKTMRSPHTCRHCRYTWDAWRSSCCRTGDSPSHPAPSGYACSRCTAHSCNINTNVRNALVTLSIPACSVVNPDPYAFGSPGSGSVCFWISRIRIRHYFVRIRIIQS
jgi:hypothetical protein